jgi:hypothetical protein
MSLAEIMETLKSLDPRLVTRIERIEAMLSMPPGRYPRQWHSRGSRPFPQRREMFPRTPEVKDKLQALKNEDLASFRRWG